MTDDEARSRALLMMADGFAHVLRDGGDWPTTADVLNVLASTGLRLVSDPGEESTAAYLRHIGAEARSWPCTCDGYDPNVPCKRHGVAS